jgi:hypothetical protein
VNILLEHRPYNYGIDLQDGAQPPFGLIYNLSQNELSALKDYIKKNMAKNFIQHSKSPAGTPIFFAKKKDGSLWICIDYCGLNKITVKNLYPLPLISRLLDQLRHAKIYMKIDLQGVHNLVCINKGDEWKTAFGTKYGYFEYNIMPFGLINAPAIFQHLILIFFKNLEEHE